MSDQTQYMDASLSQAGKQFFALLRLALGGSAESCLTEHRIDWKAVNRLAEKQSVVGLCFAGVEKLPKDQMPGMELLMQWIGQAEMIRQRNAQVSDAAREAVAFFEDHGIKGAILKGQGIGQLYDDPALRTPGDVDILLLEKPTDDFIARVNKLAKEHNGEIVPYFYHHCDFGEIGGVTVEAHWRASWFYCPWLNRRLQHFSAEKLTVDSSAGLPTPSLAFNRVYIIEHIYRHLYQEGIGMRQLVDYYYVLKHSFEDASTAEQEKQEAMRTLKSLGMEKFTAAVMWILRDCLGLPADQLLCEPCEKDGAFLLSEIMTAGNFGKHDKRIMRQPGEGQLHYSLRKIRRNCRLFRFGPWEVVFTPLWRAWQRYWWQSHHDTRA